MSDQATDQITLTIDDRQVTVPKGTLVVDAAAKLNIEIPIFCSHPKLDPVACCRMCMVEIETPRGPMLQTACSVPVAQDMVVRTTAESAQAMQEANLAFLLLNHPLDCPICDQGGECPLQDLTMRFGPGISQLVEPKRRKKKHYLISDTIVLDQERCVLCWRCIRYLEEWEDKPQLDLFQRGRDTLLDIQPGQPVDAKTGGNIIDICPVGALTSRVARFGYRPWEIIRTPSVCNHCSIGCNMRLDSRTHTLRRIVGRENMAVNDQWLCDKGRFAYAWVNSEERLTMPHVRKDGELTPVPWSEALQYIADRLKDIKQRSGADAIGGIGSAKLSNEANYLFQRFFRQIVGTNNIDHRDGAEVAALPGGMPALADVMKPQYGPNPQVDTVLLFGVDPSEELPILDLHLKRSVRRGDMKLVIAHPRQIELTRYNGPYLGYKPGSEVTLLNALAQAALAGAENKPQGADQIAQVGEDELRAQCGVEPETLRAAAEALVQSQNPLILYGPMVARGEQGERVRDALTNLALASGHADRLAFVGLEANSHGARDMGVLPNQLPGYAPLDDSATRARLAQAWGGELPTTAGKSYKQMLDEAGGAIKALFIMGANPATERPAWADNLDKLDLLVVQELLMTETAAKADVVLPARGWAEVDGTFTNLEQRVQRAPRAVHDPDSKAAPDWMILDHLAYRLGVNWPFGDERAITKEISETVPLYAGLTWDALGDQGLQYDASAVRTQPALRQVEGPAQTATDDQTDDQALALVTGTVLYDGGTLFRMTPQMRDMAFGREALIHPDDAARLGIAEGDAIVIRSGQGELALQAKFHPTVQPGTVWVPESLPDASVGVLLGEGAVESVTIQAQRAEPAGAPS